MLEIDEHGTVGERISQLITHFASGNKTAFGRAAGLQSGLLAGIVGSRQSKPSFEVMQKILTGYPTVAPNWLLFGRGEMLVTQQPTTTPLAPHQARPDDFLPADALQHQQQREAAYQQAAVQHERTVNVLRALGEYLTKTDPSPDLRAILDMLPAALTPPLSPAQEDAQHEQELEQHERQQEALSDEAHERELEQYRAKGNH